MIHTFDILLRSKATKFPVFHLNPITIIYIIIFLLLFIIDINIIYINIVRLR